MFDITKSIEQLENDYWPTVVKNPTVLTEKCYFFRKVPIQKLSLEQIRLLLTQNIGLQFLIPKAIDTLSSNILAEAEFYPGDLLITVLNCDKIYWDKHKDIKNTLRNLIEEKRVEIESANERNELRQILKAIDLFME